MILFLATNTHISYLGNTRDEYLGREGGRVAVALAEGVLDHAGEHHKVPPKVCQVHSSLGEAARGLLSSAWPTSLPPLGPGALLLHLGWGQTCDGLELLISSLYLCIHL